MKNYIDVEDLKELYGEKVTKNHFLQHVNMG